MSMVPIQPRVRASLGAQDLEALELSLEQFSPPTRAALRTRLGQDGVDGLLADPAFDPQRAWPAPALTPVSYTLFLYAIVRRPLVAGGVSDPIVSDYVATLCLEFGRGQRAWSIDAYGEYPVGTLVDTLIAEDQSVSHAALHRGNLALWLAGLFADRVEYQHQHRGGPSLRYYDAMGAAGFASASHDRSTVAAGLFGVCDHLSRTFPAVRRALNAVANTTLFPRAGDSVSRLLRDVRESME